jgi:hypothetical protein
VKRLYGLDPITFMYEMSKIRKAEGAAVSEDNLWGPAAQEAKEKFDTGAQRNNQAGKGRYDLLPPEALALLAEHYERGAVQHGDRNWEKGVSLMRTYSAAMRHGNLWRAGEVEDNDIYRHAVAALWNWAAIVTYMWRIQNGTLPPELDDRGGP